MLIRQLRMSDYSEHGTERDINAANRAMFNHLDSVPAHIRDHLTSSIQSKKLSTGERVYYWSVSFQG